MICPDCKKTYDDKVTYCVNCGKELVEETDKIELIPDITADEKESGADIIKDLPRNDNFIPSENFVQLKKKKKFTACDFARITACFVVSSAIFAAVLISSGSAAGRILTEKGTVEKAVSEADFLNVPAVELGIEDSGRYTVSENATFGEAIAVSAAGTGLSEQRINAIYEVSAVKSLMIKTAVDYAEFIRTAKRPETLTAQKLKDAFSENRTAVSESTGIEISDKEASVICKELDKLSVSLDKISISTFEKGENGFYIKLLRAYISVPALVAEGVLIVLLILLLAVISKNFSRTLKFAGGSFLFASIIFLTATFIITMQLGFFQSSSILTTEAIRCISNAAQNSLYILGGSIFLCGAATIVTAHIADPTQPRWSGVKRAESPLPRRSAKSL